MPAGYMFWQFDKFWTKEQPENVMAFPAVKTKFVKQLQLELDNGDVVLCIKQ